MEVGPVVVFCVAECFEALVKVRLDHLVVEVQDVRWWLCWLPKDGLACCEGCDDVKGEP